MDQTAQAAHAVIIFESMFGNTRAVAEAIAEGMRSQASVTVMPVADAPEAVSEADLIVVGAPTHAHGLSRPATRAQARAWADDTARHLTLEPDAEGMGVREWLEICGQVPERFAAFDTRADMPELFTGSAATRIEKRLNALGSRRFVRKQSFLVNGDSVLLPGQLERAADWGRTLATELRMPVVR